MSGSSGSTAIRVAMLEYDPKQAQVQVSNKRDSWLRKQRVTAFESVRVSAVTGEDTVSRTSSAHSDEGRSTVRGRG